MIREPDGLEVVATAAEAELLASPPLLVIDHVERYLDEVGIGSGSLAWQRIGDGQSNITYLLERGDARVVLRRGPRPPLPPSTHDMLRESRVQIGLAKAGMPVATILAVCKDEDVLGVPFYLMDFLDGEVILDAAPPALDVVSERRAISEQLVDTLADIHNIDLDQAELSDFGRVAGYLERQIATFTRLSAQSDGRPLPLLGEIGAWLEENRPETQRPALVHGDYRLGNVMFHRQAPARVLAVLDWEMAALGDPLADLGYLISSYTDATSPHTAIELSRATEADGYLDRRQLAERYARRTGLSIDSLRWYEVLALWKSAVFLEAIYTRWQRGERPGDEFAPALEAGIPHALEIARELTR